jgi:carbonic anhydrase
MTQIGNLIDGYRAFRSHFFQDNRAHFEQLVNAGQRPTFMIISCCDSRVDPSVIFGLAPGDVFMMRNVANLVPPYSPDENYHDTSAALEFAVRGLEVPHIIVFGHAGCGGIETLLQGSEGIGRDVEFIDKWMSIARRGQSKARELSLQHAGDPWQRAVEQGSILNSLDNLKTFPFVHEKIEAGKLTLHGWYIDLMSEELMIFSEDEKCFLSVA